MKIIKLTLNNSILLNILTIIILAFGVLVSIDMKREAFPSIDFDTVTIKTIYPGASPETVELYVTNLEYYGDQRKNIRSSSRIFI